MNDYFCSIGNELAIEIYDKPIHLLNRDYSVNMSDATFRFKESTLKMLVTPLAKLGLQRVLELI